MDASTFYTITDILIIIIIIIIIIILMTGRRS